MVDRQRPNVLSTDDLDYFEVRFFLVPGTGTIYVNADQSIIRKRAIGNGFHEDLTILNHKGKPIDLKVRIEVASDFADLFEVRGKLTKKGEFYHRIESDRLVLGYHREKFIRETFVTANAGADIGEPGLDFDVHIEPHSVCKGEIMKATQQLHDAGQSLWLDNITRRLLTSGTLKQYIADLTITGLTSNPTIFDHAIKNSQDYDDAIRQKRAEGKSGEALFFELALEDLTMAADLFRPIYDATNGVDGWVSLEVSPFLAYDAKATSVAAKQLHDRAARPNLFIKIPGTKEGLPAIEEAIFAGVPVNVTLLFSHEHYLAAAEAYMRGIERRIEAKLNPAVHSVASVFVSRWDKAVAGKVPKALHDKLGIAVASRTYKAYRTLLDTDRWLRLENAGASPQRVLWASTGTKDPEESDVLYIKALAAPDTVNTMPEKTLLAFAQHGEVRALLAEDGGNAEELLARFAAAGVDYDELAAKLQSEGAESFDASWNDLMGCIASKSELLTKAG